MAKALKVIVTSMSSSDVRSKNDADLKKIITDGFQKMKPVSGLSNEGKANAIACLGTFKGKH